MKTDSLTDPVAEAERALKQALGIRPSDAPPVPTTDNRVLAEFLERYQRNALAAARRYAAERELAGLEEVHRLTCHPSVLDTVHGVRGFEHNIQHHADFAVEHGIEPDVWVVRREALEKEIANAR